MFTRGQGHSYGFLQRGDSGDENPVKRILTEAESKRLNEDDALTQGAFMYEAGQQTGRFETEKALLRAAKEMFCAEFADALILIRGSRCVVSPQYVLAGPRALIKRLNAITRRWNTGKYGAASAREWTAAWNEIDL